MQTKEDIIRKLLFSAVQTQFKKGVINLPLNQIDLEKQIGNALVALSMLPIYLNNKEEGEKDNKKEQFEKELEFLASEVYIILFHFLGDKIYKNITIPISLNNSDCFN